ncbi:MAG: carbohydrate kinase family protein [Actinobacteria bacterium]|nr:carbohydrate kinase family protein [Actinomycetota bacterium]
MTKSSLDVISIGGATRDIFFRTSKARIIPAPEKHRAQLVAFEYGEKIIPEEVYLTQGGGGHNSATCFARLGLKAAAALSVGDDGSGHRIKALLGQRGVDTSLVRFDAHIATALSVIIVVERDHISFLYRGANDHLEIAEWALLERVRWFYVTSLTGRGAALLPQLAEFARRRGKQLALNPGSLQLRAGYRGLKDILKETSVLIVNYEEGCALARSLEANVDRDDRVALLKTLSRMGPRLVVITEGREGSCAFDASGVHEQEAIPVEVHDTTGAGDAYGATLVAALMSGFDVKRAMTLASMNSAAVVSRSGATEGLLSLAELERRMAGYGAA